ncbi:MAG: GNAT family N-acetyltransferase [Gammaproteobacteria bacterium]|nr:GNAT family N-acetyltransferase [Gammaproteobacteria bacterium]
MQPVQRTANITDLSFIYSCLLYGARKGHYSFNAENPEVVRQMKQEIQYVISHQRLLDRRYALASVYTLQNKRIAISIMSAAFLNDDSSEIYAVSVARQFQNRGYGSYIIDDLLSRYQHSEIYARCSPTSEKMNELLEKRGFRLHSTDMDYKVLIRDAFIGKCFIEPVRLRY